MNAILGGLFSFIYIGVLGAVEWNSGSVDRRGSPVTLGPLFFALAALIREWTILPASLSQFEVSLNTGQVLRLSSGLRLWKMILLLSPHLCVKL